MNLEITIEKMILTKSLIMSLKKISNKKKSWMMVIKVFSMFLRKISSKIRETQIGLRVLKKSLKV